MSKTKVSLSKYSRVFLWLVVFAAIIYLVVRNIGAFGNVLLVLLGFGGVVLVHEFGHFIAAKLAGIKVEAFSIFMPPILLGVRKTEDGFRFRILPKFFPKEKDESGDGRLSFTVGKAGEAWETEYRIGLIPFGGFVKMLGQEDVGSAERSDDPRSFANKPVGVRVPVIAAGVIFNAISAVIVFMVIFLIGINLPPAVIGGVVSGSPAAFAGLKPGDEVIEIAGVSDNLDFSNIKMAAALSDVNEAVALKVRRGNELMDFSIVAEQRQGERLKDFGILEAMGLAVARVSDANALLAKTGLLPGDRIKSVNGKDVETHWELEKIVQNAFVPEVAILVERTGPVSGKVELIESRIPMALNFERVWGKAEPEPGHIFYSMAPRLRVSIADAGLKLQKGDIILAVGDVDNPTYEELRDVTEAYEGKELPIEVLRSDANGIEKSHTVTVVPKRPRDSDRVVIGVGVVPDVGHSVVAKTIGTEGGPAPLEIPRGASITAVDGEAVSNFFDVIREINRYRGQRITIDWRLNDEIAGDAALDVGTGRGFITVQSGFAEFIPFKRVEKVYKAGGPVDAIVMGYKKTVMFIAQTYVTLRHLVRGLISPKDLMGPVGILAFSYRVVAEQPLIYYVYFLGLISACIAVFNFLPLPPLDGGLIVLLVVEKIKGSAVSQRVQEAIAYAGWVLVGGLFLYVTFNDIVRSFFGG